MRLNMKSMIGRKQTYDKKGEEVVEAKEEKSDILIFNYCEEKTHEPQSFSVSLYTR